jgi:hypothetical protein
MGNLRAVICPLTAAGPRISSVFCISGAMSSERWTLVVPDQEPGQLSRFLSGSLILLRGTRRSEMTAVTPARGDRMRHFEDPQVMVKLRGLIWPLTEEGP